MLPYITHGALLFVLSVFFKPLEEEFVWDRTVISSGYTAFLACYGISAIIMGGIFGPLMGGMSYDITQSYVTAFIIALVIIIIAIVLLILATPPFKIQQTGQESR